MSILLIARLQPTYVSGPKLNRLINPVEAIHDDGLTCIFAWVKQVMLALVWP